MPYQSPRTFSSVSTGPIVTSSSGWNFQFGFLPKVIRLENIGTQNIWAKFGTTGPASTNDVLITTCAPMNYVQIVLDREAAIAALSLGATSTAGTAVNLWAIG